MNETRVKILRYNPSVDPQPHWEDYLVPFEEGISRVLGAIQYVAEHYDPQLSFDFGCRWSRCGLCSVLVNGKPVIACKAPLGEDARIEPLPNFPVIRDLLIDRKPLDRRIAHLRSFLHRTHLPKREPETISSSAFKKFTVLAKCMDCLCCMAACPSYKAAPHEYAGPLGYLQLAKRLYDPRDEGDRAKLAVVEGIYNCSRCMKCGEVCPQEIPVPKMVIKALHDAAGEQGIEPSAIFKEYAKNLETTPWAFQPVGTPLSQNLPVIKKVDHPVARVGFFWGCSFENLLPSSALTLLEVLQRNRVEVVLPKDQGCCGLPLIWTGQEQLVKKHLIRKNVEAFEKAGVEKVLVACPGCFMTWKEEIPPLAEEILGRKPNFSVEEIGEFLSLNPSLDLPGENPARMKVTVHTPCHLAKMGKESYPKTLLNKVPGVSLVEMEDEGSCCGAFVRGIHPFIANRLAEEKIQKAKATGADIIATSCPSCINHLSMVSRRSRGPKVLHFLELLGRTVG